MSLSLAVVGPGRVGQALARRWVEADLAFAGFHGGRRGHAEQALTFAGAGRVLEAADLGAADRVLLAVPDAVLAVVIANLAGFAQPGSLWFHSSGFHDLDVLAPLEDRSVRTGSLHPLCPFPDLATGYAHLPGQPAVCTGGADAMPELVELARLAGLDPIELAAVDRRVYHAACVLAANGLTALCDLSARIYTQAAGVESEQAVTMALALMRGALDACADKGPRAALSGPVARGDLALVTAQLEALERAPGLPASTRAVYRSLQRHAAQMAGVESAFRDLLGADD